MDGRLLSSQFTGNKSRWGRITSPLYPVRVSRSPSPEKGETTVRSTLAQRPGSPVIDEFGLPATSVACHHLTSRSVNVSP
jgi:hypothetical protein